MKVFEIRILTEELTDVNSWKRKIVIMYIMLKVKMD
jgi:hypothetical protein